MHIVIYDMEIYLIQIDETSTIVILLPQLNSINQLAEMDQDAQEEALKISKVRREEEWQKVRNPDVITESKFGYYAYF